MKSSSISNIFSKTGTITSDIQKTLQNVTEIVNPLVQSLPNGITTKLSVAVDDLRLGSAAASLLIRTNVDDMFDDLKEKYINGFMDQLETLIPFVTKIFGKL